MFLALVIQEIGKGDPVSMGMMAERYEKGEDTDIDLAKAYYWYLHAAKLEPEYRLNAEKVDRKASAAERAQAERWLADGRQPDF